MSRWRCFTPLVKQCFVASGSALNMAGATLVLAYPPGMVLQLKRPDSEIPIDEAVESWIAAVPSIAALFGSMLTSVSMSVFGRRITQIGSIVTLIIGWLTIDLANGVTVILMGRAFQGLAMGASLYLTPILAAEYVSPKYRGSLLMVAGVISSLYVFLVQSTGLYMNWRDNAVMCTAIALANLPIAILSPESPSWLASEQRYEECRQAFRWLRGNQEEEELVSMINANQISQKLNTEKSESEMTIKKKLMALKMMIQEKAFYKPIFLMIHVYSTGQWSGANLFATYVFDLLENIAGHGYNGHVMCLNINRILGAVGAIYIISQTKRRTMYLSFSSANVVVLLMTAVYTFTKCKGLVPDTPAFGLILLHLHMFFITTCTLPVPYVIAGEIFPLKHKSVAGGFSIIFGSINTSIYVKTFPFLLNSIGIHGAYTLYAVIITYCLVIAYFYLPETKGRSLQQIEEDFIGKPLNVGGSVESLIDRTRDAETNS